MDNTARKVKSGKKVPGPRVPLSAEEIAQLQAWQQRLGRRLAGAVGVAELTLRRALDGEPCNKPTHDSVRSLLARCTA